MNLTLYNKGINAGCFFFKGQESPTSFLELKGLLLIHFSRQCLGHMQSWILENSKLAICAVLMNGEVG